MTREEAINYLRSSGMSEEQIRTVVEVLSQPAQQWISVKGRLPEKNDSVWISHVDGVHVFPVVYEPDRDFVWQGDRYSFRLSDAIAWMPRYTPEPYKEDN